MRGSSRVPLSAPIKRGDYPSWRCKGRSKTWDCERVRFSPLPRLHSSRPQESPLLRNDEGERRAPSGSVRANRLTGPLRRSAESDEQTRQRGTQSTSTNFSSPGYLRCSSYGCAITEESAEELSTTVARRRKASAPQKSNLREEKLLDPSEKDRLRVSLPDDWADAMLDRKLKKEKSENLKGHQTAITALRDERAKIDGELNDLLDLKLDGALNTEEVRC